MAVAAKVPEGAIPGLLETVGGMDALDDGASDSLESDNVMSGKAAARLGVAATVHNIAGDEGDLAAAAVEKATMLNELTRLDAEAWGELIEKSGAKPPDGRKPSEWAQDIADRMAQLRPTAALFERLMRGGVERLARRMAALDKEDRAQVAQAFPGFGLGQALDEPGSAKQRANRVATRLQPLHRVRELNPELDLTEIDLSNGSGDLKRMKFTGIMAADKRPYIADPPAMQRITTLAPEDAPALVLAGYGGSMALVIDGVDRVAERTKLPRARAEAVVRRAGSRAENVITSIGTIVDVAKGGFNDIEVSNLAPDIEDQLKTFASYSDMFGSQAYCNCEHCQSILSPAAYLVDLMCFIEEHITDPTFASRPDHPINLRSRRPDLWTLPLTCENTNTLVRRWRSSTRSSRTRSRSVTRPRSASQTGRPSRSLVYRTAPRRRRRLLQTSRSSCRWFRSTRFSTCSRCHARPSCATRTCPRTTLRQPCCGYPVRRCRVIITPAIAQSALQARLQRRFDFTGSAIAPFDAQSLLGPMGVKRDELEQLVATRFVAGGAIQIVGEKSDADSVQNDIERMHGLTASPADRLHRFTRLWRAGPVDDRRARPRARAASGRAT